MLVIVKNIVTLHLEWHGGRRERPLHRRLKKGIRWESWTEPAAVFPALHEHVVLQNYSHWGYNPGKAGQRGRNSNPSRGMSQKTYRDIDFFDFGFRGIRAETHIADSPIKGGFY